MSNIVANKMKAGDLELKEKVVSINRVVKTTKGGRAFSFSALVVVGNQAGVVGHGLGKAKEVQEAITKGIEDAKKNLIKVPIMHGTIPHDQLSKDGAAKVLIKPASHGTGVIAGGSMRAVLEAVGLTDVLAKNLGSANPHNVVKATIKALATLREPITISKTRNISSVAYATDDKASDENTGKAFNLGNRCFSSSSLASGLPNSNFKIFITFIDIYNFLFVLWA